MTELRSVSGVINQIAIDHNGTFTGISIILCLSALHLASTVILARRSFLLAISFSGNAQPTVMLTSLLAHCRPLTLFRS